MARQRRCSRDAGPTCRARSGLRPPSRSPRAGRHIQYGARLCRPSMKHAKTVRDKSSKIRAPPRASLHAVCDPARARAGSHEGGMPLSCCDVACRDQEAARDGFLDEERARSPTKVHGAREHAVGPPWIRSSLARLLVLADAVARPTLDGRSVLLLQRNGTGTLWLTVVG